MVISLVGAGRVVSTVPQSPRGSNGRGCVRPLLMWQASCLRCYRLMLIVVCECLRRPRRGCWPAVRTDIGLATSPTCWLPGSETQLSCDSTSTTRTTTTIKPTAKPTTPALSAEHTAHSRHTRVVSLLYRTLAESQLLTTAQTPIPQAH